MKIAHVYHGGITLNFDYRRLDEIKAATEVDFDMQELINVIKAGWPDQRSNVPQCIQQYFDFRDTLSYYDGIVGIGEAVVIPMSLSDDSALLLKLIIFL